MKVHDLLAASALVKVVDVLGDHTHLESLLQGSDCQVSRVRLGRMHLGATFIVEAKDQFGVPMPSLGRGHLFDSVLFPEAIAIPKGA